MSTRCVLWESTAPSGSLPYGFFAEHRRPGHNGAGRLDKDGDWRTDLRENPYCVDGKGIPNRPRHRWISPPSSVEKLHRLAAEIKLLSYGHDPQLASFAKRCAGSVAQMQVSGGSNRDRRALECRIVQFRREPGLGEVTRSYSSVYNVLLFWPGDGGGCACFQCLFVAHSLVP